MAQFTTTDFIASVRRRGSIPTSTSTSNVNNTSNLLDLATEELHIRLLPLLMAVREEFYVAPPKDYAITADQAAYAVPSRASGMVLRDVQMIVGTAVASLPRIDPESVSTTATGTPAGYYLQHNNVVLYPTPSATNGTLRMLYYARPSRLAATSACAQISGINTGTGVVTVGSVPSSWSTSTPVDFIKATSPYQNPAVDQTPTATSSTTLTFTTLPDSLAVGDWVALAEYTPIPQVPHEFQPVLAQMTVVKALEAIGDNDGVARATKDLLTLQANATQLVTPRNHGESKVVVRQRWR
jgi:hypothetical protein